jgi:3-deoxy-D-manno-octulosonate 8-phosphate phosphatase (KDO 8-P phosphatase)
VTVKIKTLILDVDGVLTDGHILINDRGEEFKSFHVRDGQGLRLLMHAGIEVIIISGRKSDAVSHRAKELGIREVYQGVKDKGALLKKLMIQKKIESKHLCCMGDDLADLPLFHQAALSIAVADAVPEVRQGAGIITKSGGGQGAVREACEMILKGLGIWEETLSSFLTEKD